MNGSGALGWTLAWRYLRRRRVAWLALVAVVLTVTIAYVPGPVMDGFVTLLKQNLRDTVADVQLDVLGLPDEADAPGTRAAIDDYLRKLPEVTAVTRRADGLVAVATKDTVKPLFGANLNGIDPEREAVVTPYQRFIDTETCDPLKPFALSEALFNRQARWHKAIAHVKAVELPKELVHELLVEWGKLENIGPEDGEEWDEFVEDEGPRARTLLAEQTLARLSYDLRQAKLTAIWNGPDPLVPAEPKPRPWTAADARAALQQRWDDTVQRHRDADGIGEDQPDPTPAVLIGREMIKQWPMLRPGGTIELWTGSMNRKSEKTSQSNRTFVITGVFDSNFYDFDSRWIYTELHTAKRFLRGAKLAETWACTTTSAEIAKPVAAALERPGDDPQSLRALLPPMASGRPVKLQTKTWRFGKDTLLRAVDVQKWMLSSIMTLGIFISGLGIMVTLTVLVTEKSRDIGILASLGTSKGQLMQVFVGTGVLIGLIGSILGLAGGSLILANADSIVRAAAAWGYDDLEVYVKGVQHLPSIPVRYDPVTALVAVVGMLISAFLFSLIPAYLAARLDPVKAIRRN